MVESIEEVSPAASLSVAGKGEKQPRSLVEILTSLLTALDQYHRAVLETDDPEAIHKMRVTTRRLQAALDLLEGAARVRKLKNSLREWRRELSLVRNYDVFLGLIEKEVNRSRPAYRAQFELIKAILQKSRSKRAARVRKHLKGARIDEIAKKLGLSLVAQPGEHAEIISAQTPAVAETAPAATTVRSKRPEFDNRKIAERAANRLEQRVAEFAALAAQAHPATRAEELHQLRIAAKRVRYGLEITSQMAYGNATGAVAWLRNLQDRIGDWHDLESLEDEIIDIVSHRRFLKAHIEESSRMLQAAAHLEKKKLALVAKLFPVRVPKTITMTSQRMVRSLRRVRAADEPGRARD
jgi:CHAD domain-containing protein